VTFVRPGFTPPDGLRAAEFVLEPLSPRHNASDHAAWSASMEHIRATRGFGGGEWPRPMSLEENLQDLIRHEADFSRRAGFTYTVLDPGTAEVIGCVYIYPANDGQHDARVLSWVRADRAPLDARLRDAVSAWLALYWPFTNYLY
jgi:RimJ/RimL family protein N-acetyltransferase